MRRQREGMGVRSGYDVWSKSYDSDANRTRELDAKVVRDVLGTRSAEAVLEVGCGTGKNTGWLAERFGQVTGIDFSPGMLAVARRKLQAPGITLLEHDVLQPWPFDAGAFDLVTCNLILEHIGDLGPVYREAARTLRPGGCLFLCEIHPYRQIGGGQAQIRSGSGDAAPIRAYLHSLAEYVNDGLAAGLTVLRIGEWRDDRDDTPRLLSVLFER